VSLGGRPCALHPEQNVKLEPVQPMANATRLAHYGVTSLTAATGPQRRRCRKKLSRNIATRSGQRARGPALTPAKEPVPEVWRSPSASSPMTRLLEEVRVYQEKAQKAHSVIRTKGVKLAKTFRTKGSARNR
jgi:hypothetical protein